MASHSTLSRNRGFTLLEIIVVMALIVIVAALGLIVSMDDYRGFNFRNERDVVTGVLQKARSQAMNNMCFGDDCTDGKAHGAYFGIPGQYVIFQGTSYATRDADEDEVIEVKNAAVRVTGFTEVVFARLSGDADVSGGTTLTVIDERERTSIFTVEDSGRIWWTN